jgi:undecaprenyl-diphosphatase
VAELIYFCAVILPWILVGGLIGYLFVTNKKIAGLRLIGLSFLSAIIAWFLASLYKYNFPRPRPFEIMTNLKPLFTTATGDAFPSSHATFFGALAVGVFFQRKKLGLIFILGAILIALARVLANVHSPLDVVVGLLFGGLVSLLIFKLFSL